MLSAGSKLLDGGLGRRLVGIDGIGHGDIGAGRRANDVDGRSGCRPLLVLFPGVESEYAGFRK
jgi:hypothetical protein